VVLTPAWVAGDATSPGAGLTRRRIRADTLLVNDTTAWVYVRAHETVTIVKRGAEVAVYGPGPDFSHSRFVDVLDALVHQSQLEDALVRAGWTLERLTTERRSAPLRPAARQDAGPSERLRLVQPS
jgi:hypothetical protein